MLLIIPQVILGVIFALTLAKTLLVADAVWQARGGEGIATRVLLVRSYSSLKRSSLGAEAAVAAAAAAAATAAAAAAPTGRRRITPPSNESRRSSESLLGAGGGSRIVYNRFLHGRLLTMHVFASLAQIAALAKYAIPATDMSCLVTHRLMMALLLFYDAYLVLFLLAKTEVTNERGILPFWQRAGKRWSQFWARAYLPAMAVYFALTFPGGATNEGHVCFNGIEDNDEDHRAQRIVNIVVYAVTNSMLMIEFVLLLALFLRPLLHMTPGRGSSESTYGTVVFRNVICTIIMLVTYAVGTAAVVFALLHLSSADQVTAFYADLTPLIQSLITLCATEVALPFGVVSFVRAVMDSRRHTGSSTAAPKRTFGSSTIIVVPKGGSAVVAVAAIVEPV